MVAELGQLTTASHNEVVLIAGSLGLSALICLLNNGDQGQTETTANLMGPFWRMGSPRTENGASIVRSLWGAAMRRPLSFFPAASAAAISARR